MLSPAGRSKLWLLLGALAFMGLFAMHGLNGHGVSHAGDGAQHHHEAIDAGSAHGLDPCDGHCVFAANDASTETPGGAAHDLAMALCLAVLAIAGLLNALARSQLRPALLLPVDVVRRATPWPARGGHDPPTIFHLSVQRC